MRKFIVVFLCLFIAVPGVVLAGSTHGTTGKFDYVTVGGNGEVIIDETGIRTPALVTNAASNPMNALLDADSPEENKAIGGIRGQYVYGDPGDIDTRISLSAYRGGSLIDFLTCGRTAADAENGEIPYCTLSPDYVLDFYVPYRMVLGSPDGSITGKMSFRSYNVLYDMRLETLLDNGETATDTPIELKVIDNAFSAGYPMQVPTSIVNNGQFWTDMGDQKAWGSTPDATSLLKSQSFNASERATYLLVVWGETIGNTDTFYIGLHNSFMPEPTCAGCRFLEITFAAPGTGTNPFEAEILLRLDGTSIGNYTAKFIQNGVNPTISKGTFTVPAVDAANGVTAIPFIGHNNAADDINAHYFEIRRLD